MKTVNLSKHRSNADNGNLAILYDAVSIAHDGDNKVADSSPLHSFFVI